MVGVNIGDKVSFRHLQGRNIADNYTGTYQGLFFNESGHHSLIRVEVETTGEVKDFYTDEIRGFKVLGIKLTV